MFDEKTCSLVVPPVNGTQPLMLPFLRIYTAQNRIQEIATVNAHKAPELLACFNEAYLDCKEHIVRLTLVLVEATKAAATRRAVVILDEAPKILKDKGLSSSKDLRDAVLDQDSAYVKAMDKVHMLEAMVELLKGKMDGIEMAYTSVKKILGGENNWYSLNQNHNLSTGHLPENATPGVVIAATNVDPNSPRAKFGGAK